MRLGAPFRLLRFPGLFLAIFSASLILATVSSGSSLFLAAAGGASFEEFRTQNEDDPAAITVTDTELLAEDLAEYRDRLITAATKGLVSPPIKTISAGQLSVRGREISDTAVLMVRTGALDHVDVIDRGSGPGIWLTDYTADRIGVGTGDAIDLIGTYGMARTRVRGIYRDLYAQPRTPYWSALSQVIYGPPGAQTRPPPFMFVSRDLLFDLETTLSDNQAAFRWEFPLPPAELTLEEARDLRDRIAAFELDIRDPTTQLGATLARAVYNSPVGGWVRQAEETIAAIGGPIDTLSIAGRVVALLAVGAAGLFEVRRRRIEFTLLHARGTGPLRLGARAAVEAILPVAAGAALGWGAGVWLVRGLGPGGAIEGPALRAAAESVALTAGLAALLVGAVAGWIVRTEAELSTQRFRRLAAGLPWEPIVLAVAGAVFYEISTRGTAPVQTTDGVPEIDRLLLLFPILVVAGGTGLVTRLMRRGLARLRTAGGSWPAPLYLGSRRLASASRLAASLVTAAALAVGMLAFAFTLSGTVERTAGQEARLFVGSEAAADVSLRPPGDALSPRATIVVRILDTSVSPATTTAVDVLALDPETFEGAAFWENGFSSSSLEELLARIDGPRDGEAIPAVVAGKSAPVRSQFLLDDYDIPVRAVGRADAWPGMLGDRPLVVTTIDSLEAALTATGRRIEGSTEGYEVWTAGTAAELGADLQAAGLEPTGIVTAREVQDTPDYLALTWMFRFLQALGLAAALVVLVATHLFLQTRQRESETSYALATRMGLTRSAHRSSVAVELAGMLVAAFVVGTALALLAARLTYEKVEVGTGPASVPVLSLPLSLFAVVAVALVCFAWLGAWLVQRRADATNVAQVMRYAD